MCQLLIGVLEIMLIIVVVIFRDDSVFRPRDNNDNPNINVNNNAYCPILCTDFSLGPDQQMAAALACSPKIELKTRKAARDA